MQRARSLSHSLSLSLPDPLSTAAPPPVNRDTETSMMPPPPPVVTPHPPPTHPLSVRLSPLLSLSVSLSVCVGDGTASFCRRWKRRR